MNIRVILGFLPIALLVILTAIAGYAYSKIGPLSLPIPRLLAFATVVLPFITGVSTQSITSLISRSSKDQHHRLTLPLIAITGFLFIYDTIIATLSLSHIVPPSALLCGLNERWTKLANARDGDRIRAIQDAFKCCGFKSVRDKAFPFGKPSTCAADYGRTISCLGPWRQAEQVTAGLLLLVAVTVFILKILQLISLLTATPWSSSKWTQALLHHGVAAPVGAEDDQRAVVRRLIENRAGEGDYRDEVAAGAPANGGALEAAPPNVNNEGPRVQPSALLDLGNEWRDEGPGQEHRT